MRYSSPALAAQAAAAADVTTLIGTYELEDDAGTGVTRVVVTPPPGYSTVTGVATNNATISVRQLRGGSVLNTVASVTLNAGTNLVAETPLVLPISTAGPMQPDDVLDVLMHQNGTGLAIGAGLIVDVDVS